jgi:hypothetical protein
MGEHGLTKVALSQQIVGAMPFSNPKSDLPANNANRRELEEKLGGRFTFFIRVHSRDSRAVSAFPPSHTVLNN